MAGGPNSKPPNHHPPRWDPSSSDPKPSSSSAGPSKSKPSPKHTSPIKPKPRPENPIKPNYPFTSPPPPPSYGFHMLQRRTISLPDGSVRSYFALPPDYQNFPNFNNMGPRGFGPERPMLPMSPEFPSENPMKRKFSNSEDELFNSSNRDRFDRQGQQLLHWGNLNGPGSGGPSNGGGGYGEETVIRANKSMRTSGGGEGSLMRSKGVEVDPSALKKAFLHFVKLVYETSNQKKSYLADGKQGPVACLACARSTKDFTDTHSLVMHAYNSDSADSAVDHLAFHKALCILMGWNYMAPPDNSKAYQRFSADDAEANQDDLIMWPPSVLIHNTITGKGREGRMEGLGNRAMDSILRDLGFTSGKSMSLYSKGHIGIHMVKFSGDDSGLKDAMRLSDYFEREKRGRKGWARFQPSTLGKDDENNPNLVKLDSKTGEKKKVLYGHLATVADLDKITFEIKKKISIVSLREYKHSK